MSHPNWNEYVRVRLPQLGLRPERESEVIAELAAEFDQAYLEALQSGASEAEARVAAEGHVRDWNLLADELRAANHRPVAEPDALGRPAGGAWWRGIPQDLAFAWRALRKQPVFAAVSIVTLAFGIGGNTTIFAVADHLLWRALPYSTAARLLSIENTKAGQPEIDSWCSIDNMLEIRQRNRTLEYVAGVSPLWNAVVRGDAEPEHVESLYVSADFFPLLGVNAAVGRVFTREEDDRAKPVAVAVLSHGYWLRRFNGDRNVIGRTFRIDNRVFSVIGVMPADFRWRGEPLAGTATEIQLWLPLAANQLANSRRTVRFLKPVGLVKAGVNEEAARKDLERVGAELIAEHPGDNGGLQFSAVLLQPKVSKRIRPSMQLLLASVAFVLLMASSNVASLLLARGAARRRELSVRVALGASVWRIVQQLVTESLVIAICGGVAGLALAMSALRLLGKFGPAGIVQGARIGLDWRALLFTAGVVVAATLLAGLAPAIRAAFGATGAVMREGRGNIGHPSAARMTLATLQIAFALALVTGAGLLIRSFLNVIQIQPGFQSQGVVSIATQLPPEPNMARRYAMYESMKHALLATPGVVAVGAVSRLPMLGQNLGSLLIVEGRARDQHPPEVEYRVATPSYFGAMGIPLKAGRLFHDRDSSAMLIDEVTAKRHFPNEDPVGKRLMFLANANGPWFTIVGVVGAVRHFGLESEPRPIIYRLAAASPLNAPILVIKTASSSPETTGQWIQPLARVIRQTQPSVATYEMHALEGLVVRSTAERRFLMWVVTAFAAAALLLAAIGFYGAISQSVASRTQEIGVRMALGASPSEVLSMVFAECARVAGLGIVIGLGLSWVAARVAQKLLFLVQPHDALVMVSAVVTLLVAGGIASYAPARRATRVDPLVALREE